LPGSPDPILAVDRLLGFRQKPPSMQPRARGWQGAVKCKGSTAALLVRRAVRWYGGLRPVATARDPERNKGIQAVGRQKRKSLRGDRRKPPLDHAVFSRAMLLICTILNVDAREPVGEPFPIVLVGAAQGSRHLRQRPVWRTAAFGKSLRAPRWLKRGAKRKCPCPSENAAQCGRLQIV
jgi:hypothetical protein